MKMIYIYPHGVYSDKISSQNGNESSCVTSSVSSKILWQIDALKKNSVDIRLVELEINLKSPISYLSSSYRAYNILKQNYESADDEIIYIRTMVPFVANYLCSKKHQNIKKIYELESIGISEVKSQFKKKQSILAFLKNIYVYLSIHLFEKKIGLYADGLVSVTSEIENYYRNLTENKVKYLTLGNGITHETIPMRIFKSVNSSTIHVLSVSSVYPWHGLDRFILGLASYTGDREICLHIVGNGPEIPHLKEMVEKYNLSTKVVFHGFKSGAELDEMFDMCQIALGSLAGFRAGLQEISSLKNREYCVRGMPFIAGCTDCDFPQDWPYIKMISNDDTPLDMDVVISFADSMAVDLNHPEIMRKYAEDHLSWDAKMKTLKEFLESL